jgi:hypothetical protein
MVVVYKDKSGNKLHLVKNDIYATDKYGDKLANRSDVLKMVRKATSNHKLSGVIKTKSGSYKMEYLKKK